MCHCRVRDYALTARCGTGGSEIILRVVHGSGCRVWHCAGAEYEYIYTVLFRHMAVVVECDTEGQILQYSLG